MEKTCEFAVYLSALAGIAANMRYCDWRRAVHAIDKKFSSECSKVTIENPEEFKKVLRLEFDDVIIP